MASKLSVLFLCTGNACRSQMAEAWLARLYPDRFEAHSAGVAPTRLDPRAVAVMAECGVDLTGRQAKHVDTFAGSSPEWVVTVCDTARERCPAFGDPARRLHAGFDDPQQLAAAADNEEQALTHYRRVRDEIREFVERLPDRLSL